MSNVVKYEGKMPIKSSGNLKALFKLDSVRGMISQGVAKGMTPERIAKMALTVAISNPKLLQCTQESIVLSLVKSAQMGLDCSGALGQAYLVPYGKTCNLIVGYSGLLALAHRSGQVKSIQSYIVWKDEVKSGDFVYEAGLEPKLEHRPDFSKSRKLDKSAKEEAYCVYAVAQMVGGGIQHVIMPIEDVEVIKSRSASGNYSGAPWDKHWVEMAKKTALRRLMKYMPMSIENENLERAIGHDNEQYNFSEAEEINPNEMPMTHGDPSATEKEAN